MTDRILDKYLGRKPDSPHGPHAAGHQQHGPASLAETGAAAGPEGSTDDLGCFGWLRGVRERAVMLELRKSNGSIMAIGYGWLERAEFDPTEGITLHVAGRTIRIKGRRLNDEVRQSARLFEGITRHRVPWVRQVRGTDSPDEDATIIESIEW